MRRHALRGVPATPFHTWLALSATTAEMLLASAHVIGHRTGRMMKSGPRPSAVDRREFALMGSEKVEAALRSTQSMMSLWMSMWAGNAGRILASQLSLASAFGSLAASRTPGELAARQRKLVKAIEMSPASPAKLAHASTRLARRGLAPIHSRAVANSKRLRKL